jgi:phospholipid transport system substrate-binding protein
MFRPLLVADSMALALISTSHAEVTPEELVRKISTDVLEAAKNDQAVRSGDVDRVQQLVDAKVMPSLNFEVATRAAVGPKWRQATAEQRAKLQSEFKTLLLHLYSGALRQVKDQTVEITKTLNIPGSTQVVVETEVRGSGEPIKLDYRLDKFDGVWKIIDVNVGGLWLVQTYRSQFAGELSKGGIDGLINALVERNKAPPPAKS